MHMADALLSPAVGGTLWAATAGAIAYSSKRVGDDLDDRKIPLMGVLGAFVFAAQMINFTIPGTGSSGHLGGGLLLAVLLGPHAALLTLASVLSVQALFFADGGLLALGSNIFNLGFLPCFLAYPLVYRSISGASDSPQRMTTAAVLAAVVGLQLGALGVVSQTTLSGISELPFSTFALLMQPIHLAIGIVEGLVTAAVLTFLRQAQPEILVAPGVGRSASASPQKKVMAGLLLAAALTGGVLSWFASERPDGLEWSIARASDSEDIHGARGEVHRSLERVQQGTAVLPDYALDDEATPPEVGTSLSGLVGGAVTLTLTGLFALLLRRRGQSQPG